MNAGRKSENGGPFAGGRHYSTRGWVTPALVAVVCMVLVAAAYERGRGNLHRIRSRVDPQPAPEVLPTGPGGQEPVHLSRSTSSIGRDVELVSATFLPGRGMNVFQITALVPGHGEVPLLLSPSIASATEILTGQDSDANGSASSSLGGAILLPWARRLAGSSTAAAGMLSTDWNGRRLSFPAEDAGSNLSVEGLLLNRGADSIQSDVLPDGQSAAATFHAGDFSGNWPSNVDVFVEAQLTEHDLDLTVTAKNTGQQPTPFGVGWKPYFAIPSGNRAQTLLRVPSQTVMEMDRQKRLPTGRMLDVGGEAEDLSRAGGVSLGTTAIDTSYTNLISGGDGKPAAEISYPAYNLRISVIPLTPDITSMHVVAPEDKPWISIEPNTNLDDPFGPEWNSPENAGIITLAPGATLTWKVRLEISALSASGSDLD